MRLSIPLGTAPKRVTIRSAEAVTFRVPMDLKAEDSQRTIAPFNYLVHLTAATAGGKEVSGLGEAQSRPHQTGDSHEHSWPFLDEALARLVGEELDLRDPLSDIRSRIRALETKAGESESLPVFPFRATIMGIETALLDLAAAALGMTVADLLGRRRVMPTPIPPVLRHRDAEAIDRFFSGVSPRQRRPLRLLGTGDVEADLEHLRHVATSRSRLHRSSAAQPLWMNFRGRLDVEQAHHVVRTAVQWSAEGQLPKTVILQNPLPSEAHEETMELQRLADELASGYTTSPDVRLLARNAGPDVTADLVKSGAAGGGLRMINLRPAQIGGVLRTLELAEEIRAHSPQAQVLLTHFPGASRITTMLHRDMAKAVPNVEYLSTTADVEKRFRVSGRRSRWRRTPLLRLGLGLQPYYEDLVTQARARVLHPTPPQPAVGNKRPNTYGDVDYISPIGAYAVHGHIVEREALAHGLNSWRFNKSSIVVSDTAGTQLPFRTTRWPLSGVVAASVARHKEATRILLKRAGVPVPEGRTFHEGDHGLAVQYAQRIGFPVVLKPAEGSMGVGVTANIRSESELDTALEMFSKTAHGNNEFIVEKHINGGDYRIMVIGDHVAAAVERIPANVVGDGVQTVGQLIMEKNVARRANPHLGPLKIRWDAAAEYQLHKVGYGFDSVLPVGERVYLLSTNNLTQGGESIEILDDLHPSIQEACVKAVQAVPGMGYCGVDFLLEDHTKPLEEQDAAICELNAMAALPVAEYPVYGTPRRLSEQFVFECADAFGLQAQAQRAENLNLRLTIRGGIKGVGYGRWFARRAARSGLVGWVKSTGEREAEARIYGPTAAAAAMVTVAILGPPKAAPESVKAIHVQDDLDTVEFVLLNEAADEGNGTGIEPGPGGAAEDFEEASNLESEGGSVSDDLNESEVAEEQLDAEAIEDKLEETPDDR
ncbi:acylphosphatase [Nesterenkonia sphaerica]|uniref:ATP-grasp domain-containing protein n=1 Tax=Nesterenkonia sphaerica TaxID=1804988 RepID=A0A5R9AKV2_9MICC|nr:acylphosphatase [Nesterenkonia sphaerica]TLP79321.1 ATP-grasp domain-containing protein [Nesterenkonia sphaerica]